jgi:hypothetical protein
MSDRDRDRDRTASPVASLDGMPENDIRKMPLAAGARAWVRRRLVEARYIGADTSEIRPAVSTFDIWVHEDPRDLPREPLEEPNAHAAAQRLMRYESGVAADTFMPPRSSASTLSLSSTVDLSL